LHARSRRASQAKTRARGYPTTTEQKDACPLQRDRCDRDRRGAEARRTALDVASVNASGRADPIGELLELRLVGDRIVVAP
jgi:hypothetical protein